MPTFFSFFSTSVNQREVTHLLSVKKRIPSRPKTWLSPKNESLWPAKGKKLTGTGMPTLMPTMPACVRLANSREK